MVRSVQDLAVRVLGDLGVRQKGEKDADQCVDAGYRRSLWTKILSPKETFFPPQRRLLSRRVAKHDAPEGVFPVWRAGDTNTHLLVASGENLLAVTR